MKKNTILGSGLLVCSLLFLTVFSLTLLPVSEAAQQKPIELKMGLMGPPNAYSAKHGFDPWAKMVEEATHGKVKVNAYHAQSLFKVRDTLSAITSGLADITFVPVGYFAGRFDLIQVVSLPFLMPDMTAERASNLVQELYETTPAIQKEFYDMKVLYFNAPDSYIIATKKKPVRNMNDLKGLKLRSAGKWPSKMMKVFQVNPVMLPMPEIYEAASKGIIDGALTSFTIINEMNLHEVLNYWMDAPMWRAAGAMVMNLERWDSLPPDVRKDFESVIGFNGCGFIPSRAYDPAKGEVISAAKKGGQKWERIELDQGEYTKWKETIGRPMWQEWVKDMEKKGLPGQEVLDKALSLIKKYQ
jgi:TRAP-type C4-dicarboxylate transport system substrate-binding protein